MTADLRDRVSLFQLQLEELRAENAELREVMAALLDFEADTAEEVHAYQAVLRRAEKLLGRTE